jgi:hypothetical protein
LASKELAVDHNNILCYASFFTKELLTKGNMTVVLHPPYFSLFPQLNIKLKSHHFDTIEVKEVESQAVLNTVTEHNSQDALIKWQSSWKRCICLEGDYFQGDGIQ